MSRGVEFASISGTISVAVKTKESAKGHQQKFNPVKECHKEKYKPSQPQRVYYKPSASGKLQSHKYSL